jgi:Phosphoribosylformylglycinamidine (FGAM) synthase, synthetase domain
MLQLLVLVKRKFDKNHAQKGDVVVLLGGATGRDGIGGSQFASDSFGI